MKTISINLYKFDELSEEGKKKAIETLSDINIELDWWEYVYSDAESIGLKITSFDLYRKDIEGEFNLSASEIAQNILNSHGEECETYKTAQTFLNDFNPLFAQYMDEQSEHYESQEHDEKLVSLESDFRKDILEDYRIILQNEYEYICSEQAIIETIEVNDYDFLESGELY